ncbi:MAG: NADPH-dependent FMN reductase [Bdellovibrionales bacterium]
MLHIIVGTNRPQSMTKQVSLAVQKMFEAQGHSVGLIDLADLQLETVAAGDYLLGAKPLPAVLQKAVDTVKTSEGLIVITPEYNGGMPGALKTFIDHWKFPESFVGRPVAFIGLAAGIWGGQRPVEHLSQIFAYRSAYQFPVRVFLPGINKIFVNGEITEPNAQKLLKQLVEEFPRFCQALKSAKLDSNSRLGL